MRKHLHTRTKIFFSDPYVVRVEHEEPLLYDKPLPKSFLNLKSRTYKLIQGTWGFSNPENEMINDEEDSMKIFAGLSGLSALFSGRTVTRSYWCFQNEIDALQFRLMVGNSAKQVHMWPERWFTIHEVIESNES